MRRLYVLGTAYVAASLVFAWAVKQSEAAHLGSDGAEPPGTAPAAADPALSWFRAARPFCNPVEVDTRQRLVPPPATDRGTAFSAACYGLAGRVDEAHRLIEALTPDEQWRAAGVVFEVAHPVADAGNDRTAGPIMELVVEFWPNHYQALYHAGMYRYEVGDLEPARRHLESFLSLYAIDDGFRRNALVVLDRID